MSFLSRKHTRAFGGPRFCAFVLVQLIVSASGLHLAMNAGATTAEEGEALELAELEAEVARLRANIERRGREARRRSLENELAELQALNARVTERDSSPMPPEAGPHAASTDSPSASCLRISTTTGRGPSPGSKCCEPAGRVRGRSTASVEPSSGSYRRDFSGQSSATGRVPALASSSAAGRVEPGVLPRSPPEECCSVCQKAAGSLDADGFVVALSRCPEVYPGQDTKLICWDCAH